MKIIKNIATLFILLLLATVTGRPAGASAASGRDLLILYSNNVHGEIEPCG